MGVWCFGGDVFFSFFSNSQHTQRSFLFPYRAASINIAMPATYGFGWKAPKLVASLALFLLSGLLEIIGGWFVWRAMLGGESGGESPSEEAAIYYPNPPPSPPATRTASSWHGFPTPPRASPARLWLLLPGISFLVVYGFVPVVQTLVAPSGGQNATFGRVFAVYGGFFIGLSYLWGWLADGTKPDGGDALGASVAIAGVLVAWFWPRVRGGATMSK